jgi:hypothetical protein
MVIPVPGAISLLDGEFELRSDCNLLEPGSRRALALTESMKATDANRYTIPDFLMTNFGTNINI